MSAALTVEKRGRGRPSKYHPSYPELAFKYCLLGADDAALARNFEVSEPALYRWMRDHPEFRNSICAGREEADANVAHSLYHRAVGYDRTSEKIKITDDGNVHRAEFVEHYPSDTRAGHIWLINRQRHRWRDTPVVAVGVQASGENVSVNMQPLEVSQGYMNLIESEE